MSQAWSEFDRAVTRLTGPGTPCTRLSCACIPTLVNLRKKEFPSECQADFKRLTDLLGVGIGRTDSQQIAAAIAALGESEATELVALLIRIHRALSLYQPRHPQPVPPLA